MKNSKVNLKLRFHQMSLQDEGGFISPKQGEGGQAVLVIVVFFLFITLAITFGLVTPVVKDARLARATEHSVASFFAAESGLEDVFYRKREGMTVGETEVLSINSASATTTTEATGSGTERITAHATAENYVRRMQTNISTGSGASFNYGVQAGNGGFDIRNTASITGSAYANGPVTGANSNVIRGTIVSAGPNGLISNVRATGTAYANEIADAHVEGDAYYQTISNTTVEGTEHPDSEDKPFIDMPISDSLIEDWKTEAADGGILSCSDGDEHEIENDVTIGPGKFPCDVEISGDPIVTLTGPIWVEGDLTIKNKAVIEVDSSLSGKTIQVIADVPSNRFERGIIELKNQTKYNGAGDDSYILFISMNNAEEQGEDEEAIEAQNTVEGQGDLVLYAPHGRIELSNNISLNGVTGYTIELKNTTEVVYETGIANMVFEGGPGGTFTIDTWKEVE